MLTGSYAKKVLLSALLVIPLVAGAIDTPESGFRLSKKISEVITKMKVDAHSFRRNILNDTDIDYFVPTKTETEWQAFRDHLPAGISLAYVDCASGSYSDFTIPDLTHGGDQEVSKLRMITNGWNNHRVGVSCDNGDYVYNDLGEEIDSCDNGYFIDGSSCVASGCNAATKVINGHTYNVPSLGNGASIGVTSSEYNISNGQATRDQNFVCSLGNTNASGGESVETITKCITDFYQSGSTCTAVGTGYYSNSTSTGRVACTNQPSNSNYTSDGNGSNNCSWGCTTDYRSSNGTSCSAVGTGYYSANSNNSRTACSNKPASSNYISDGNGSNSCSW